MNKTDTAVFELVQYALLTGLIEGEDCVWAVNSILDVLKLDRIESIPASFDTSPRPLHAILDDILDDAHARGLLPDNSTLFRDLLDTALMGRLTPRPSHIIRQFSSLFLRDPRSATDWFYALCRSSNYIRTDRISRDLRWKTTTDYGELDITINLSKPEKDPRAIAAAGTLAPSGYPACQLCAVNEGYPGRLDHPARQNLRMIPLTLGGENWFFQYSPYVYYNEHCICLNASHTPMKIDRSCFIKLLAFVAQFPHYFVGSNADLPIVGGSILSHDHFQGGCYSFAMERAEVEIPFSFPDFADITCGIVKWPLSVLRITGSDPHRLALLADRILTAWRGYSDASATIFSHTGDTPHNTVTPIARRRGELFELDLVLRNNLTTSEHPLGLYHPHAELHHIKKENIGLIEVMGLAVLPARLKTELSAVADGLLCGSDLRADPLTALHADWAEEIAARRTITPENVWSVIQEETGLVFAKVLEHAGVFRRDEAGKEALLRFLSSV